MKKMLLLICLPIAVFSQNTIGLPDVINYSKQTYSAGLQNWDIQQDKNGIIYIANNEGLLSFDGKNWTLFPLPNKTIVRSVAIGNDGKIYVGGQDEIGYFAPGKNGYLQYNSLIQLIPLKDKAFGDLWDIVVFKNDIFFRTTSKIFKFSNQSFVTFKATNEWAYLGICNNQLLAQDAKNGILGFTDNVWQPLFVNNSFIENDPVTAILPINSDSALITTLKNGLFILSKTNIAKIESINNQLFKTNRIYAATKVNNQFTALATNNNGIYIIDNKGNVVQSFSKTEGLQNNNVLTIFLDNQSNLWLGLDNGVDFIAYNSAIKHITPTIQNGSGYATIIHNKKLYIGTSNGLFSVPLENGIKDISFSKGKFEAVDNTYGQTWALASINNQLLLGHHEGAFNVSNNSIDPLTPLNGFWNFLPVSTTFPTQQMLSGNYRGISYFNYANGKFEETLQIPNFHESSRFFTVDKDDNIWVSHPYHGVFKIFRDTNNIFNTTTYTQNGLPSILDNQVFKIRNEVVFATSKGIYTYNTQKNIFEPSIFYNKILRDQSLRYLKEDASGNVWFIHDKTLGVIDFSGKEPNIIYLPELDNKMISGFECIYPVNDNNIFLGSEKGFFNIDFEKYKKTIPNLQVQIRSVKIIDKTDSLLFGGYFKDVNDKQIQNPTAVATIKSSFKTIQLSYAATLFGYQTNLKYSYRLKGFNDNWSEWTTRTDKEYTNLPAGKYVFEVRVRSNLGNESVAATYAFNMLPPWYLSILAKLLYAIIFFTIIYALNKWQHQKFEKKQEKIKEAQKQLVYIHELEITKTESELVTLRNEKLEADINFKNSELASSAMHLVKKSELLTKLKSELTHMMKGIDNSQAIAELKKLIKSLSEDDNMDKEWEHFSKHFDKVHSDFLVELKEKHTAITPNELKLSAYLRMNLSTKEIAQLMNISVRGVEISRYRLRKKLALPSDTSLFDYLIGIQGKA
jgi:ligand-binding sensor domain-containing protein/DNA-binding CsgD family transcriptional regulator